jgi:hypothetical protein
MNFENQFSDKEKQIILYETYASYSQVNITRAIKDEYELNYK